MSHLLESRPSRTILILIASVMASACGPSEPAEEESTRAEQPVVNGQPIDADELPSVVMLNTGTGICTGTFITDSVVLTAAHCLVRRGADGTLGPRDRVWVVTAAGSIASLGVYPSHGYVTYPGTIEFDLGFVVFPSGTSAHTSPIGGKPAQGSPVTVVGFGIENGHDAGVKRAGTNVIRYVGPISLALTDQPSPHGSALPWSGDSGGPLLVDGKIVGVAHSGGGTSGAYVALYSQSSQAFLRSLGR